MDLPSIVLIALALSMDAFAVSIASGMVSKKLAFKMSLSFGNFQAIMPIVGWGVGTGVKNIISSIDHWIGFFILTTIGIKMIYEAGKMERIEMSNHAILLLSIATSIDAFAVGMAIPFLGISILMPAVIIGVITFAVCMLGFALGGKAEFLEEKAEILGGIVLIGIGIKILLSGL